MNLLGKIWNYVPLYLVLLLKVVMEGVSDVEISFWKYNRISHNHYSWPPQTLSWNIQNSIDMLFLCLFYVFSFWIYLFILKLLRYFFEKKHPYFLFEIVFMAYYFKNWPHENMYSIIVTGIIIVYLQMSGFHFVGQKSAHGSSRIIWLLNCA